MKEFPDVSLAVLTFRRPHGLEKVLNSLIAIADRSAVGFGICEILVIDNDPEGSGRRTFDGFSHPLMRYSQEPVPGVSAARNRALSEAAGDILVFIDDDEHAGPNWPDGLIDVMQTTGAAMVGGPVRSLLPPSPPTWVAATGFFDRPEPAHLTEMTWLRSGNLAIDLAQVAQHGLQFEQEFGQTGGEDVRFTVSAKRAGLGLRWAADSVVYEDVAPSRLTLSWVENRAASAMTNYVRANAPLSTTAIARILLRSSARLLHSCGLRIGARITRDDNRSVAGRIEFQRAKGALAGLRAARKGDILRG